YIDSTLFSFACSGIVFLFIRTVTNAIYTLSLHDALPIYSLSRDRLDGTADGGEPASGRLCPDRLEPHPGQGRALAGSCPDRGQRDRKSTRLNSSHVKNSYAVFCLKKKKNISIHNTNQSYR